MQDSKVHLCPLLNIAFCLPTSSSVYLFSFLLSLCPVQSSLLSQITLRCGQTTSVSISWPRSGICHIFQWLLGSFCEHPHRWHGPCVRCVVVFGSISSQKPASFSLALPSRSITHKRTKKLTWQGIAWSKRYVATLHIGFSVVRAAVAFAILERPSVLSLPLKQLLQGTLSLPLFQVFVLYLDLPLDAIGAVCHLFGLLLVFQRLHFIPCADFVETFN